MAAFQQLDPSVPALLVGIGPSWYQALQSQFSQDYFIKLANILQSERSGAVPIYPSAEDVFSWTRHCTIHNVNVVILGQDPYHGPNMAHGLAFSVQQENIPASLKTIYEELCKDIPGFSYPCHGNLIGWAEQGVLLLNTCLTVKEGQPYSHKGLGWEMFTDAIISWLSKNKTGLVFMLWGQQAQTKAPLIDKEKHLVLQAPHPSPMSAYTGFIGCQHFSKCNEFLSRHGKPPIDWNHLPMQQY